MKGSNVDGKSRVEEMVYVLDMAAGLPAARKIRKQMYGTDPPPAASTLTGASQLALPEQLVEVSFRTAVH